MYYCYYCSNLIEPRQLALMCVTCKNRMHSKCYFIFHPIGSLMHINYGCDKCKMKPRYKKYKDYKYTELPE